jgi:hypothetical protein
MWPISQKAQLVKVRANSLGPEERQQCGQFDIILTDFASKSQSLK